MFICAAVKFIVKNKYTICEIVLVGATHEDCYKQVKDIEIKLHMIVQDAIEGLYVRQEGASGLGKFLDRKQCEQLGFTVDRDLYITRNSISNKILACEQVIHLNIAYEIIAINIERAYKLLKECYRISKELDKEIEESLNSLRRKMREV